MLGIYSERLFLFHGLSLTLPKTGSKKTIALIVYDEKWRETVKDTRIIGDSECRTIIFSGVKNGS